MVNPPTSLLPVETFVIIMENVTTSACNNNHGAALSLVIALLPRGERGLFFFYHCLQHWVQFFLLLPVKYSYISSSSSCSPSPSNTWGYF